MSTLDKAGILKAMELKRETVTVEGGEIILTEIPADEYMEIYTSDAAKDANGEFDGTKFTALLATRCIIDKKGKRIFDDADAEQLRKGSTAVYTKIAMAVKRLNGLGIDEKN
jgi:hypothetical protein